MNKERLFRIILFQRIILIAVVFFILGLFFGQRVMNDEEWEKHAQFSDIRQLILRWTMVIFAKTNYVPHISEMEHVSADVENLLVAPKEEHDSKKCKLLENHRDPIPFHEHSVSKLVGFYPDFFLPVIDGSGHVYYGPRMSFHGEDVDKAIAFEVLRFELDAAYITPDTYVDQNTELGKYKPKVRWYLPYRDLDDLLMYLCKVAENQKCEDVVREEMRAQKTTGISLIIIALGLAIHLLLFSIAGILTAHALKLLFGIYYLSVIHYAKIFFAVDVYGAIEKEQSRILKEREDAQKKTQTLAQRTERMEKLCAYVDLVPEERRIDAEKIILEFFAKEETTEQDFIKTIVCLRTMIPRPENLSQDVSDNVIHMREKQYFREQLEIKKGEVARYRDHVNDKIRKEASDAYMMAEELDKKFLHRPQKALHVLNKFLDAVLPKDRVKNGKK